MPENASSPTPSSVVIVGGGLAGAKAAEALRDNGYSGTVTLLAAEDELPYERPPLSKDYLAGKAGFDDAVVHDRDWYANNDIDLRTGAEVVAVRRDESEVELADGSRVPYGALVLATGSEPVVPPLPGAETALYLRTHADADRLKAVLGEGKRVVVVGGGWIGLEVAAAARGAGAEVTVLESAEFPLLGVLGREMAAVFADLHRDNGVDLRTGAEVAEILTDGDRATGVRLADGEQLDADAVVVGVGARPRLDVARSALLDTDSGVLVDGSLRTGDPAIWAVGDIAEQQHPVLARRVRVEHWANAQNQGSFVGERLAGKGGADEYDRLPYFYSDQFDLGMEYVGQASSGSYARVIVRGDLTGREFVAFWLDGQDRILAAMNVNVWDVADDIKPLIADGTVVDADKLADPEVALTDVAA